MTLKTHLILTSLIVLLSACNGCNDKKNDKKTKLTKVSLRQEWFPNSNYAGALMAKNEFAKSNGLDISIESGSDQIDPIRLVIEGHNTFGDASADKILSANEKGADLVIIGVVSYNSPTCFLAKAEKKILTPKDFEGKTVGILTGTNTEYVYRTLVKKEALNTKKIKEVEAPFDLNSFVTANAYDVRPAYIYDEPVSLDLQKIKYTVIEPKNYGVKFLGTVYFTTRQNVLKNPEIVQAFVNSVADGWAAAIKSPEKAIEFLKEYDKTIDTTRELLSLRKGLDYYKGKDNKILWADISDWEEMIQSLQELKVIKTVNLGKTIDTTFLHKYYAAHK
jgi:NitT/TauT family transport system substrate-binding protein